MYFVIRKSRDDQYYWLLKGENRETVAVSETYKRKQSAEDTIESIQNQAKGALVLDMTENAYDRQLP